MEISKRKKIREIDLFHFTSFSETLHIHHHIFFFYLETERMPKQDANIHVGEVPDIVHDGLQKNSVKLTSPPDDDNNNNNEDESINFDEFFDLAVLQNDLLSSSQSTSSNQMVLGISVLLTCLILSLSCNST